MYTRIRAGFLSYTAASVLPLFYQLPEPTSVFDYRCKELLNLPNELSDLHALGHPNLCDGEQLLAI